MSAPSTELSILTSLLTGSSRRDERFSDPALNPRFQPTIRMSLTSSQVLRRPPGVLKRLASAVQLRPWPPHFKALSQILSVVPVCSQSAFLRHAEDGRCSRIVLKDLGRTDSSSVRSQSAFMRRVAEEPDGIGEHNNGIGEHNNKVNELSHAGAL